MIIRKRFQWWQLLTGPAHLIDGIVNTLTFGTVDPGVSPKLYRSLARIKKAKRSRAVREEAYSRSFVLWVDDRVRLELERKNDL